MRSGSTSLNRLRFDRLPVFLFHFRQFFRRVMRRDIQPSKPHFDVLAVDLNTNEFSPAGDGYGTGSKATGKRVENDIARLEEARIMRFSKASGFCVGWFSYSSIK